MPFDAKRGQRLKDLLEEQHWEVEEFARQSGIGRTTLYGYLRGAPIGGGNLTKLAATLKVDRATILDEAEPAATALAADAEEPTMRDLLAAQQETNAILLRLERLLTDQRGQRQPSAPPRTAGQS